MGNSTKKYSHDTGHHDISHSDHQHSCCENHIDVSPIDFDSIGETSENRAIYYIENMDCPMEEALIRQKLKGISGISSLEFNLLQRILTVNHELSSTQLIESALKDIDMKAEPINPHTNRRQTQTKTKTQIPWKKLTFAGIFAGLAELFELINEWHISFGQFDFNSIEIMQIPIFKYAPLFFAIIAIFLAGFSTYKKGWIAISHLNLNINALMAVAVTGAVMIGQYPEAAMVMVLFNISEAIEAKALDHARESISHLIALAPEKATVQQPDGTWLEINSDEVKLGMRVRVKPGERIALDGKILQGHSSINQAPITGESLPIEKSIGDIVYAGTINESGSFEFEVTAIANHSMLARIIHTVEEAQNKKAPIQRFVDVFAKYYTPLVFVLALLVALVSPLLISYSWYESIYTGLVILVIACPCALVISTPVTIVSGMTAATRYGILVKGGVFLEQGRKLSWLALDKTGTITYGKPKQTDFIKIGDLDENQILSLAASLATRSDHPVSKAIAQHAYQNQITLQTVTNFKAILGQGVYGEINENGWYLGNHRLIDALNVSSKPLKTHIEQLEKQGKSVVTLANLSGVQGIFAVADTLKESSIEAIQQLKQMNVKTIMLTGDNEHTAGVIASQVDIDVFKGNLLPEDKMNAITELEKQGHCVGMVGDGINDAPALAKANIGFAMAKAGTDTAIETADVALMDDDLRKIPRFISLSKSTYAILIQNITLALSVKALFFILTFMGLTTMWMAVFADVGTALLVVANGLRVMNK